ncbi:MAG: C2H2-type zinc finger protein [Terriglobales bacterium]
MNPNPNSTSVKKCQICNKSFQSDHELQAHQNSQHSGNEQGGPPPQNEQVYGDPPVQDEQKRKKIA